MKHNDYAYDRHRFDRQGNVVRERRRPGPLVGSDDYRTGDRLFAARPSSPARERFREARRAVRTAA